MKKLIPLTTLLFFYISARTQIYNPDKIDKKAVAMYTQGMQRAEDGNNTLAAGLFQQAIQLDKNYLEAYIGLASVYGQLNNYRAAVEYYEKAFALDPVYTIDYKLAYSIKLAAIGEFEKALAAVNELLDKKPPKNENSLKNANYRKRCYEFAVEYAKKNKALNYVFAPHNVGSSINTEASEYCPSLTIDGSELVFTRRVNFTNEDFYYSKEENKQWQPAKPMEGNVNTGQNEAAQNISQDGQWLVFTACDHRDGFGSCDLYISFLEQNGWSEATNMGRNINTDQWESQPCLSPDKRDLYFASRRFGGLGGSDIYVSHLQSNGTWGQPENLGPGINTSGDEQCPFIHADNQTLYFSSSSWPGYGDDDLFFSRKGANNAWSQPMNLGYPINTIDKEGTLFITSDGKTAYYASDRGDTKGGLDIYSFELREDLRPFRTLWVKGQVFDKKTTKGLASAVELIDITTRQTISKVQTDEQGKYMITLPVGKTYAFNVNRKGYLFYSDNYSLSSQSPDSVYQKNIPLQPIEVNASVVLKNIFFDTKKFELNPNSQVELDKVVQLLSDNPTVKIQISGHTDNVGKPADNLLLSNNRAKAVVSYLVSKGISPQRLSFKGFGETVPIAKNTTEDGRAANRRTELKVTSK
jgi:outer membrane protein OmpA-like peptidoglycan-associated protein